DRKRGGFRLNMADRKVQVAVYQKAKSNNYYCGDSYFYTETENEFVCALADGLGSGEFAKESSQAVIDIIRNNINANVEQHVKKSKQKNTICALSESKKQ